MHLFYLCNVSVLFDFKLYFEQSKAEKQNIKHINKVTNPKEGYYC